MTSISFFTFYSTTTFLNTRTLAISDKSADLRWVTASAAPSQFSQWTALNNFSSIENWNRNFHSTYVMLMTLVLLSITDEAHRILNYLNKKHSTIKFEMDLPNNDGYLPILDIQLKINPDGTIQYKPFTKKPVKTSLSIFNPTTLFL